MPLSLLSSIFFTLVTLSLYVPLSSFAWTTSEQHHASACAYQILQGEAYLKPTKISSFRARELSNMRATFAVAVQAYSGVTGSEQAYLLRAAREAGLKIAEPIGPVLIGNT